MVDVSAVWTNMPAWGWVLMVACALLVGFSKTALGNVALVAVAIMAWLLPARDSTGVLLVMLFSGDIIAVSIYRRDVDWRLLARMIPPVLIGLAAGWLFLGYVDNTVLARTIGIILLVLVGVGLWTQHASADGLRGGRLASTGYGALAGFTTMVANAGGPAMSLYLLAARFDKWRFLGTQAWFFFAVNVVKLPVSMSLGIVRPVTAALSAVLIPGVVVGAVIGRILIQRINQKLFERLVMILAAAAAVYLVIE